MVFKELIRRPLERQPCHSKEHLSRRGAGAFVHTYVCLCVCAYLTLYSLGKEEDWPFNNYHGTIRTFQWCLWTHLSTILLSTSSHLNSSLLFSSTPSHALHFCTLDHPLSVLLLRCFVTSSHTYHGVIWTGGETERLGKERELKEMRRIVQIRWLSLILDIGSLSGSTATALWSHPHTHYCLYCSQPWSSDYILFAGYSLFTCVKKHIRKDQWSLHSPKEISKHINNISSSPNSMQQPLAASHWRWSFCSSRTVQQLKSTWSMAPEALNII